MLDKINSIETKLEAIIHLRNDLQELAKGLFAVDKKFQGEMVSFSEQRLERVTHNIYDILQLLKGEITKGI